MTTQEYILYSLKRPGASYIKSASFGEIIEYPETQSINRNTQWDDETIVLGEITVGRKGTIVYNFSVPPAILSKARLAKIYIDRLQFSGVRKKAVGKVIIGKSTLYFIQDQPTSLPIWFVDKPDQAVIKGFWAKKTWQRSKEPQLEYYPNESCIQIPCTLLSPETAITIEVGEMQEIVIHSIELRIWQRARRRLKGTHTRKLFHRKTYD
jgi:hypothetical protein